MASDSDDAARRPQVWERLRASWYRADQTLQFKAVFIALALMTTALWALTAIAAFGVALADSNAGVNNGVWHGLARLGQAGDAFGGVNALFSGMAFLFVVVTVYFQVREMDENRASLGRERKEQFLSARLNATLAMLQATELDPLEKQFVKLTAQVVRRKWRLRHRIGILLAEAHLGFDDGDWTPQHEDRAIRGYLAEMFADLWLILQDPSEMPAPITNALLEDSRTQMGVISEITRSKTMETRKLVSEVRRKLAGEDLESSEIFKEVVRDVLKNDLGETPAVYLALRPHSKEPPEPEFPQVPPNAT